MIESKSITIEKTARYYTLGRFSEKIKTIWFVFHGYGQLAKEFLDELKVLENDSTFIVAPEAINKFYLRSFSGKIGATWMTKEDRENEIIDYSKMIEKIFASLNVNDLQNVQINVLGFSQGSHTAVRWLNKYHHKIDNLLLWGTAFPHDCDYKKNNNFWRSIKTKIIIGNKDRFISENILEKEKLYLQSQNLNYKFYSFDGGHSVDINLLSELLKKI